MKLRIGFVSNSSSSSFVIVNKTDKPLKLKDFVGDILEKVLSRYDVLKDVVFEPGKKQIFETDQDCNSSEILNIISNIVEELKESYYTSKWQEGKSFRWITVHDENLKDI